MPMQRIRKIRVPRNCAWCKNKIDPSYKEIAGLSEYVSERGRILGKDRTGVCSKHQRKLAREVKRARHLAMLPFVSGM